MNAWSAEFMFKRRIFLVGGITVLSLASQLLAEGAQKPCTREEAMQAADDTDHLDNWNAVYRSFKRFSQCDDGGIAEGYSDDVGKLLADHWDQFPRLVKLVDCRRVTITRLLASKLSWPLAAKSYSPSHSGLT
jgi:hypothetical protein